MAAALIAAGVAGVVFVQKTGAALNSRWILLSVMVAGVLGAAIARSIVQRRRRSALNASVDDAQTAASPRRRQASASSVEAVARRLGLSYVAKARREERSRLSKLARMPKPTEIRHLMRGEIAGRALTAFQHTYIVPAGQVMIPVVSTVYLAQAPTAWPKVVIAPTSAWRKALARLRRRSGPALDLDAFNRAFAIETKNPEFAILLLTPDLQEWLLDKRRQIKWVVGEGAVRLIYPGRMQPKRIERSIDRLKRFVSLLPAELEVWREEDALDPARPRPA